MSIADSDISLLRAQDDLAEFSREIIILQVKNDELNGKVRQCFEETKVYQEQNRLLSKERDDLKNAINLADDGISVLNRDWKAKFAEWKYVEGELRKQIKNLKSDCQLQNESNSSQIDGLKCSKSKLVQELNSSKSEIMSLQENVKTLTAQLETMNEKLKMESQNSMKNMFASKENEILQGKVEALESRVNTFYEESRIKESFSRGSTPLDKAEREVQRFDITPIRLSKTHTDEDTEELLSELKRLKGCVVEKDKIIEGQQIQINEHVCANEAQLLKIKYYQTTLATAKESYNQTTTNLKDAKEKQLKVSKALEGSREKLIAASKDNSDLKNSLIIKTSLLAEKDQQVAYYRRCSEDQENQYKGKCKDLDNFRHTVSLMESEKVALQRTVESMQADTKRQELIFNQKLVESEVIFEKTFITQNTVQSELSSVTKQLKLALREKDELQNLLALESSEYHDQYFALETKFKTTAEKLEAMKADKAVLKDQLAMFENTINNEILSRDDTVDNLTKAINTLEATRKEDLAEYTGKIQSLVLEIETLKEELAAVTQVPDKISVRDKSQNTSIQEQVEDAILSVEEVETIEPQTLSLLLMKSKLSDLTGELEMKNKLLLRAQQELNTKIIELSKNQWDTEKLRVKMNQPTEPDPAPLQTSSEGYTLLVETIGKLEVELAEQEKQIQSQNQIISSHLEREGQFAELSDLIARMQSEIELKQASMNKEIDFYKKKISDIDEVKKSMLDKSINTSSLQDVSILQTSFHDRSVKEKNMDDLDLSILENVMNNLQAKCEIGINDIHDSYCAAIADIKQDTVSKPPQEWIMLSTKN